VQRPGRAATARASAGTTARGECSGRTNACLTRSHAMDDRDAALTEAIGTHLEQTPIPGAIVGVWRDGRPPYTRAFGVRDTASRQQMAPDFYTRIGSVTKPFVVTAVLQLVDQGKVRLDDPIDKYVPGVPGGAEITLRQLAGMRSGLCDYFEEILPNF